MIPFPRTTIAMYAVVALLIVFGLGVTVTNAFGCDHGVQQQVLLQQQYVAPVVQAQVVQQYAVPVVQQQVFAQQAYAAPLVQAQVQAYSAPVVQAQVAAPVVLPQRALAPRAVIGPRAVVRPRARIRVRF